MHADAAVDLVVQADLAVRSVLIAAELNAVHAEVGALPARALGMLGVYLRQRHEGAAVVGPTDDLR